MFRIIIELLQKRLRSKQQEVLRLKWQKAELEQELRRLRSDNREG